MRLVTVLVLALAGIAPAQEAGTEKAPPAKPVTAEAEPAKEPEPARQEAQQLERAIAELRKKLRELEGQLARTEREEKEDEKRNAADVQEAAPVAAAPPVARAGVMLDVRLEPRAAQAVKIGKIHRLVRGAGGNFVFTTEEQRSPLVQGDYEKALEELDEARREMSTAEEIPDAMRALDRATKALMEARTALWKQRDENGEAEKKAEPAKSEKSE